MANTQRTRRYRYLRAAHFTPYEARELSVLPKSTPALRLATAERLKRWDRFAKAAQQRVQSGQWRQRDLADKWLANLGRLYYRRGWRVKGQRRGRQPYRGKGLPNVWAMYRSYERQVGGPKSKDYVSPWQVKKVTKGASKLQRGVVFVQKLEKQAKAAGGVNKSTIRGWIAEKEEAIWRAKGKNRAQLIIEKNRLERML